MAGPRRALLALPVGVTLIAVGCGTTDKASRETLAPIRTTTSTSSTSTTSLPEGQKFYVIKRGDTLAVIAASFGVPVQSIVEINGLPNPDAIQAGQTIEIPSDVIIVDELPALPAATTG